GSDTIKCTWTRCAAPPSGSKGCDKLNTTSVSSGNFNNNWNTWYSSPPGLVSCGVSTVLLTTDNCFGACVIFQLKPVPNCTGSFIKKGLPGRTRAAFAFSSAMAMAGSLERCAISGADEINENPTAHRQVRLSLAKVLDLLIFACSSPRRSRSNRVAVV